VACLTAGIYSRSLWCGFVNLDDPQYVTDNAYVLQPSWEHLAAIFSEVTRPTTVAGYYQPLTMASLMLDSALDGPGLPKPWVFHLTNVLLHALNAVLVFAWIRQSLERRLSGSGGLLIAAAAAALMFGLHPVNVEVVSWVCQRKALLSTMFALATLLMYGRYARAGGIAAYVGAIVAFMLSLLSKPTGSFLPLVLLALDVWPYGRVQNGRGLLRALIEKAPLFALAVAGAIIAKVSQGESMGRAEIDVLTQPLTGILIVCHNVGFYLYKLVWPANLSPQYPRPEHIGLDNWRFLAGVFATLFVAAGLALAATKRWLAIVVGLGGFFVLLAPAIGVVDFMGAIAADRFLYQPMLPLMLLAAAVLARYPRGLILAALVVPAMGAKTWAQQAVWQDSFSYWEQARAYDPNDVGIIDGLANAHLERYDPDHPEKYGVPTDLDRAEELLKTVIERRPSYTRAYFALADIMLLRDKPEAALQYADRGLSFPKPDAHGWLARARALSRLGRYAEAVGPYEWYLERRGPNVVALQNLGNALSHLGRFQEAESRFDELIRIAPSNAEGHYMRGYVRTRLYGDAAAIDALERACALQPDNGVYRVVLAARYAAVGRMDDAKRELSFGLLLKPDQMPVARQGPHFAGLRDTPWWAELEASVESRAASQRSSGSSASR